MPIIVRIALLWWWYFTRRQLAGDEQELRAARVRLRTWVLDRVSPHYHQQLFESPWVVACISTRRCQFCEETYEAEVGASGLLLHPLFLVFSRELDQDGEGLVTKSSTLQSGCRCCATCQSGRLKLRWPPFVTGVEVKYVPGTQAVLGSSRGFITVHYTWAVDTPETLLKPPHITLGLERWAIEGVSQLPATTDCRRLLLQRLENLRGRR